MVKLNLGSEHQKLDGFGLPQYTDGSVEAITISDALIFLPLKEPEKFIKELWRVLRYGGVVSIAENGLEPKIMCQMFEEAGFSVYDKPMMIEAIKASLPPKGIKPANSLTETPTLEKNPIIDMSVQYGSFLPALIKVMNVTDGPVLELGMGMFSTPYLHFACYPERKLVSYESDKEYYNLLSIFKSEHHEIHFVKDWDEIDLSAGELCSSGHWSVVLVDHNPTGRRREEIKRLLNSADYIVVHDTNPRLDRKYRYSEIYPLFKFRKDFNREKPYTAILSNFKDLSNL